MNKVLSNWFKRYLSHPESVILFLVLIGAVVVFKTMEQILAPIIISVIIAYPLAHIVKKIEKWRCPHLMAVSIVFLIFINLLLLLFLWLLPLLWEEMVALILEVPTVLHDGQLWLLNLHNRFPDLISTVQLYQFINYATAYFANFGREVVSFSLASLVNIVTLVVYLILVPLLVFFFLRDGKNIIKWMLQFLPEKRPVLQNVWNELCGKVGNYIHGKFIEIILISSITIFVFWIMKLHYAVLLGALVGLSVMVPYIGMIVVTVPIVVVSFVQWGWSNHFLYLMLIYAVINIIDANILVPILFAEVMSVHPLAIVLAVLIFGNIFGFWGVFFAIPLIALVNVILKAWPRV